MVLALAGNAELVHARLYVSIPAVEAQAPVPWPLTMDVPPVALTALHFWFLIQSWDPSPQLFRMVLTMFQVDRLEEGANLFVIIFKFACFKVQ